MKQITKNILNTLISKYGINVKYPDTFILSENQVNSIIGDFTPKQNCNSYGKYSTNYYINNFNGFDFQLYSRGKYTFCSLLPSEFDVNITEVDEDKSEYKYTLRFRYMREYNKWLENNKSDIISIDGYNIVMNSL